MELHQNFTVKSLTFAFSPLSIPFGWKRQFYGGDGIVELVLFCEVEKAQFHGFNFLDKISSLLFTEHEWINIELVKISRQYFSQFHFNSMMCRTGP
jgi:hypothetical protein